jgi:cytochrome b6-f complex iron-sulfur subunit
MEDQGRVAGAYAAGGRGDAATVIRTTLDALCSGLGQRRAATMRAMPPAVVPPAVPAPIDTGCQGCSRRAVLQGFAMTAATVLVGCQGDPEAVPDAGPGSTATMCGTNLCLDLNDPLNAALRTVDGSMTVNAPKDNILLLRTSTTAVQALSDICTHAGCPVRYDRVGKVLECPCHGSQFSLAGAVIGGPATRPLKKYLTQLDTDANLLTILL